MPSDEFEKIFSMYARLNEYFEGQGIGLYLARNIIYAAGGKIEVESEPGKGSTFTVYFAEA
jgi:two-component system CheB/CheR fusion protein